MKKKFSLWFNIATICLCICAIAIGVYAAQSASLTVTGSIGFKAHGLNATVKVEMYGHAMTQDGDQVKSTSPTEVKPATTITDSMSILIQKFYFIENEDGESVGDIVIKFTYQNYSVFEVLAKVTTAEDSICASDKVTAEVKNAYMEKGSEESPSTGEMTVTLKLAEGEETLDSTILMSITLEKTTAKKYTSGTDEGKAIKVNKYTSEEQSVDGEIYKNTVKAVIDDNDENFNAKYEFGTSKSYVQEFPYYITMGSKNGTAIKWLIVGYKDADDKIAVLEASDKAAFSAGIVPDSKNYVALSAEALETRRFHSTTLSTNDITAQDYYLSEIRTYLTSIEDSGFANTYSIKSPSITIKPRALRELYDDIDAKDKTTVGMTSKSDVTGSDNFWLLSQAEVYTLFNVSSSTDHSSASITTTQGNTSPCWWWLRSPHSNKIDYVKIVYSNGNADARGIVTSTDGAVRAAFQF